MAFTPQEMREYRAQRRALGYCTVCLKTRSMGRSTCRDCQERINEKRRERRWQYEAMGLCTECGEPATKRHCFKHAEQDRAHSRASYHRRIAEGKCPTCCRINPDAGHYSKCHSCDPPEARFMRRLRRGK